MNEIALRALSGVGLFVLLGLAWLASSDRAAIDRRTVRNGLLIQLVLAVVLLATPVGEVFFAFVERPVALLIDVSQAGTRFVFGPLLDVGDSFALGVLPIIVVVGSLFGTLYYLGWIQPFVRLTASFFAKTMNVSGAEALAAVANIFLGMTEAGLVVRPYLARMTRSELFSFMTVGMSTIAGTVLVAYSLILGPGYAGHLVVASLLSAPAGLVVAKLMVPETEVPETRAGAALQGESTAHNLIDAAAEGGLIGLRLALNIGALLVAFVALVALANHVIGGLGSLVGAGDLTLQSILGLGFAPIAFLMGIPWSEARDHEIVCERRGDLLDVCEVKTTVASGGKPRSRDRTSSLATRPASQVARKAPRATTAHTTLGRSPFTPRLCTTSGRAHPAGNTAIQHTTPRSSGVIFSGRGGGSTG